MESAEIENREAVRLLASKLQSQSFSSPSSSLSFEETEEEKGGDSVSLSTSSMSTNPTPDNPLYASRGGLVSKSVKEYKAVVDKTNVSAIVSRVNGAADGINEVVEEIIRTTRKLEIKSDKSTAMDSNSNDGQLSSSSCLSGCGIATVGLHEDFNKSPEPVVKRQLHQISEANPIVEFKRMEQNNTKSPLNDDF